MYKVVLAGGLASGKSTVMRMLEALGAETCSLDDISVEVRNSPEAAAELAREFGDDVLGPDGKPVPAKLAERAFRDADSVARLNAICLPRIGVKAREFLLAGGADGGVGDGNSGSTAPMRVLEVPLLDKATDLLELADESVAVTAPEELRFHRAMGRGLSREDARHRLDNQVPQANIEDMVDTVIENLGDREELERKVADWWNSRVGQRGSRIGGTDG